MKILFLIYHGFSDTSGISKKINNQVKGLVENDCDVHLCYYDYSPNGTRCRYIDGVIIKNYGFGWIAAIRQRFDYQCIYNYCVSNRIELVYARSYQNASPLLINLFRRIKRKGIKCVTEIPTYPYDHEFSGFPFLTQLKLCIDKLFRKALAKQMDAIVTFSNANTIFGQRTINISNGVDFDSTPLHVMPKDYSKELHFIGVAEVHYWHGFDRMIAGIGEYYLHNSNERKIFFHIVGGVWKSEMYNSQHARGFSDLIDKYNIAPYIIFHDQLFGQELNCVFDKCCFAIGSLARHRSGLYDLKTLKNREYASRGIPFIYSEKDTDFDDKPYIIKAPPDETPIHVERIIDFVDNNKITPLEIRESIKHLAWNVQMKTVINNI